MSHCFRHFLFWYLGHPFSRPYFRNGQEAVVMVVVRPSVRLSVTYVLWLNGAR